MHQQENLNGELAPPCTARMAECKLSHGFTFHFFRQRRRAAAAPQPTNAKTAGFVNMGKKEGKGEREKKERSDDSFQL